MAGKSIRIVREVEPEYVSADVAEQLTGVSRWTWRDMCYSGRVASTKLTNRPKSRLLIPISEIRRVLAENLRPVAAVPVRKHERTKLRKKAS